MATNLYSLDGPRAQLLALYALELLDNIRFADISPVFGMMYACDAMGADWMKDRAIQTRYLERYRPQVENEVKLICLERLTDLYTPFLSGQYARSRSRGLPIDVVRQLQDYAKISPALPLSERYHHLEALELTARDLMRFRDGHVATRLSLAEVVQYLAPPPLEHDLAYYTEAYIQQHVRYLSILYRLFTEASGRMEDLYAQLRLAKRDGWVECVPCQTPEGALAISDKVEWPPCSAQDRSPSGLYEKVIHYLCLLRDRL